MAGYQTTPNSPFSTQPVYPGTTPDSAGGGAWDWVKEHLGDIGSFIKDNWKDVAKTGADAAGAYLDYDAKQKALAQQKEQFEKQYGLQSNAQQASIAGMLNRAPLADKGQYLALNFTGPQAFQPRDYTRGLGQLSQMPTGGAQAQLAANNAMQANYKSGMGGVDTTALKMILQRLGQNVGGAPGNGPPNAQQPMALGTAYNNANGGAGQGTPNGYPTGGGTGGQTSQGVDPANPYNFPPPQKPTLSQVYEAWNKVHPGQNPPAPTSGDLMRFWEQYRQEWLSKHAGG